MRPDPSEPTGSDDPPLPKGFADLRGQVFEDRYRITDVCAVAHDHVFFAGTAVDDERAILLQLLRPVMVSDRAHAQRLEQRVKTSRRIRHPNVVCPIDSGERFDGTLYLVSERPPGIPLPRFIENQPQGRVPWSTARPLLLDLVRGLGTIHKRRAVHGALHPRVCWVEASEDGEPQLRLLGLGSNVDPIAQEYESRASGTAPFAGDPRYVAPENIRGLLGDALSDAYLVGLVAYTILVGEPPFLEGSPFQILASHLKDAVPSAQENAADLPNGIDALLSQLLAKEPSDRPKTMADVEQALLSLEVEEPSKPNLVDAKPPTFAPPPTFTPPPAFAPPPTSTPRPRTFTPPPRTSTPPAPVPEPAPVSPELAPVPEPAPVSPESAPVSPELAPVSPEPVPPKPARTSSARRRATEIYNARLLDDALEAGSEAGRPEPLEPTPTPVSVSGVMEPAPTSEPTDPKPLESTPAPTPAPKTPSGRPPGGRATEVIDLRGMGLEERQRAHPLASTGVTRPAIPPDDAPAGSSTTMTGTPVPGGVSRSSDPLPPASRSSSLAVLLVLTAIVAMIGGVGVGMLLSGG